MTGLDRALLNAAMGGYTETCALLIERGAQVNATDNYGQTPLHWAASGGHTETCALLLERGGEVNARDVDGWTSLGVATRWKHTQTAALLRKHGAIEEVPQCTD